MSSAAVTQPAMIQQLGLPFIDPSEPHRIIPNDRAAYFSLNWLSPKGILNRRQMFEADELETVVRLIAGQPNIYMSQAFMDRRALKNAFVQYGTHAYTDLDYYRVPALAGRSRDELVRDVRLYCDDTGTPQPSAIIGSGRGIYCKWYYDRPVSRSDFGHVGRMIGVNRGLQKRLAYFGADPKATDAARVLRVTGSEHTGAQRLVSVLHLEQQNGKVVRYEFEALAALTAPAAVREPDRETVLGSVSDMEREARADGTRRHFTREGWFWAIIEDCYTLARLRYPGGVVPAGSHMRDIFGHVIACQLARILPPNILYREIIAAVSRVVEPGYVHADLASHSSTLLRLAREAWVIGEWSQLYRYGKMRLIDLLEITATEEPHMRALISGGEKRRRAADAERARRRANGAAGRAEYEANAVARRPIIARMRHVGMSWRAIAAELGITVSEAHRQGTGP